MLALKHMKWNDPEKKWNEKGEKKPDQTKQNHFLLKTAIITLFNHLKPHENTVKLMELEKEEVKRPRTGENQISKPDGSPGDGSALANLRGKGLSLLEGREDSDWHQKSLYWLRSSDGWVQAHRREVDDLKWSPHHPMYSSTGVHPQKTNPLLPQQKTQNLEPWRLWSLLERSLPKA